MTTKVLKNKINSRLKRKTRIRSKIFGVAECPRVSIFKSNKFIYAQVINDTESVTIAAYDGSKNNTRSNKDGAKVAAAALAVSLKEKNIDKVVFDRNGYLYHGVVAEFAQELRNQSINL